MGGEQKSRFQILREEHEKQAQLQTDVEECKTPVEEIPSPKLNPLDGFTFKINDAGDLIFDQQTVTQPELDKSQFKREFSSQFSELDRYKKALVKTKTALSRPPVSNRKWSESECELFWRALSTVGQDFQLMENFFQASESSKTKNQ